jgi:mRNA interferase RelE/StbE
MIDEEAGEFLDNLSGKSNKIVKRKLLILEDNPFPKKGGDKELLISPKYKELYRLHISRSYTAFYRIIPDEKTVIILWLGTIDQAHKLYGRFKNLG